MIKLYESFKQKKRIEIGQCVVILYHFFDIAKLPKSLPEMIKLSKIIIIIIARSYIALFRTGGPHKALYR